jgi:hypothetical protein
LHKTLEVSDRFYGFEIWVMRGSDKKKTQVSEIMFLRHVDLVRLLDKQHNEQILRG